MTKSDVLIRPDGTTRPVCPKNGKNYGLQELYELLECGMVQRVDTTTPGMILVCDEEGLMVDEPQLNPGATLLADTEIVGTVLLCHSDRVG